MRPIGTRACFLLLTLIAACSKDQERNTSGGSSSNETEEDQAIRLVIDQPEVQSWLAQFCGPDGDGPVTGGRPAFRVDRREGGRWIVHAFESITTHTATFNWYAVDLTHGTVKAEF